MTRTKYGSSWDSPRLKEMMALRDQGLSNHEVAERMGVHISTVSGMVTIARSKYGWRPPEKPKTVTLSDREHKCLTLYAQGHKSRYIADTLDLSTNSVDGALTKCQEKFDLANREELFFYARLHSYDLDTVEQEVSA